MDSATLRQEVSSTESDLRSSQRDLTFAVAEESNTEDQEKKGEIGNKIEKLKGDIGVNAARHSSAIQDLRSAEASERKEEACKQTEKEKAEEIEKQKTEELAKKPEETLDADKSKDKKISDVIKTAPVLIGGELYNITDSREDPKTIQDRLFAELQKQVTPEAKDKDPHAEDAKDKPTLAANVGAASTTPAIASINGTGASQDSSSPTATSRIQGAAGSSSTST